MGSVHKEACCNIYVGSTLEHVAIEKFYQRMDKAVLISMMHPWRDAPHVYPFGQLTYFRFYIGITYC